MDFVRIDRVGIELEGGWVARLPNANWVPDGSVRIQRGDNGCQVVGEMISAPMSDWPTISDWVYATYPIAFDRSCGIHVHVSFKERRSYARLMDQKFYEYFLDRMQKWGKRVGLPASHLFWSRLEGANHYCQKKFVPDAQAIPKQKRHCDDSRYAHLNYAFRLHGTIECRLAPVFKQPKIAVSYVQELLAIYEEYLLNSDYLTVVERVDDLV